VRSTQKKEAEGLRADRILALDSESELASLKELDAVADTVGHEVIVSLIPHIKKNGVLATVLGKPEAANGRDLRVAEIWAQPDSLRLEQLAYEVAAGKFSIPIRQEFKLSDIRSADPMAEKAGSAKSYWSRESVIYANNCTVSFGTGCRRRQGGLRRIEGIAANRSSRRSHTLCRPLV
jgi:NADPH:quinone reductase-like Zn-dependent oxidoreductase